MATSRRSSAGVDRWRESMSELVVAGAAWASLSVRSVLIVSALSSSPLVDVAMMLGGCAPGVAPTQRVVTEQRRSAA